MTTDPSLWYGEGVHQTERHKVKYVGYAVAGLLAFAGLLALGTATSWFGLVTQRPMAQYAMETNRLTESNSRNRVDGVNSGIMSLCLNMRSATDPNTRRAFATLLISDADSFQRQDLLTDAARSCRQEAGQIVTLVQ